jgi:branched-chain amino acid aminotransferase
MPFNKAEYIWFNGELVPWDQATVHVTAHALHYGSCIFEGIRAYATPQGPAVLALGAHVRRLFDSAQMVRLSMPYNEEQICSAILDTVRANRHRECYIRPLVYRGSDGFSLDGRKCPTEMTIVTFEWGRYLGPEALEQGIDAMVSSWRRLAPDTSPSLAKTGGNYVNSQLIAMEAADNGFGEGLSLDINGYVSEGSGENIFLVHRGVVYTPELAASILLGVTRNIVITLLRAAGYEVREARIPREMLYAADEIFLTGTAAEITPVRSVDRIQIGAGRRGPVTERLQHDFFAIAQGETKDKYGWLTHVGS